MVSIVACFGLLGNAIHQQALLMVVGISVAIVSVYPFEMGRCYEILFRQLPADLRIWNRRGVVWEVYNPDASASFLHRREAKKRSKEPLAYRLDEIETADGLIGLFYDPTRMTDSFVIYCDGRNLLSTTPGQQQQELARAGVVAANLLNVSSGLSVKVTTVFMSRSHDVYHIHESYKNNLREEVYRGTIDTTTPRGQELVYLRRVASQNARVTAINTRKVTVAFVVTIGRKDDLDSRRNAKRSPEQQRELINRQPIVSIEPLARRLLADQGFGNPETLDATELALYIREHWDVGSGIARYRERFHTGEFDDMFESGASDKHYMPETSIRATRTRLYLDDRPFCVLKITEQPQEVPNTFWPQLMQLRGKAGRSPVWMTLSNTMVKIDVAQESTFLRWGIPIGRSLLEGIFNRQFLDDPAVRKQGEESQRRRSELFESGAWQVKYIPLIALTATNDKALNDAIDQVQAKLQQHGFKATVVSGQSLQLPLLFVSAGLGRML